MLTYQHTNNNPIRYNDPTGHTMVEDDFVVDNDNHHNGGFHQGHPNPKTSGKLCDWFPKLCEGGQWNPLTYDTVGIKMEFDAKLGGGIEIKPFIIVNGDDLRNLNWAHGEGAVGLTFEVTSGASADLAGGVSLTGSDGTVLDQGKLQPPNGNLGGCLPGLSWCFKGSGSYSFQQKKMTSVAYTAGGGDGFDLSVGQPENLIFVYGKNNKGWWRLPFSGERFPIEFGSPIP